MKTTILLLIALILTAPATLSAQDQPEVPPQQVQTMVKPKSISSGFYLKMGASIPTGAFAAGTTYHVWDPNTHSLLPLVYLPAKIGGALDMGYLIYIGPSFANKILRAGIDATFLTVSFNSTQPLDKEKRAQHYYYFGGQKFGPLLTINPVDRLMIDLSYKLNANFCYYYGEWNNISDDLLTKYGITLLQNEVSMTIRYRIASFSLQYNFGDVTYNNMGDDANSQDRVVDLSTFRIMLGFKF